MLKARAFSCRVGKETDWRKDYPRAAGGVKEAVRLKPDVSARKIPCFSAPSTHLISHLPEVPMADGILVNVRDADCIRIVPPVKPGPDDQP